MTYVSERTTEFRGVAVNDDWVRSYPEGRLGAHILGYTGAVTQEELKLSTFDGLDADSIVGKSGVELSYEEALRGKPGRRTYNVDALGRIVPRGAGWIQWAGSWTRVANPLTSTRARSCPTTSPSPCPATTSLSPSMSTCRRSSRESSTLPWSVPGRRATRAGAGQSWRWTPATGRCSPSPAAGLRSAALCRRHLW